MKNKLPSEGPLVSIIILNYNGDNHIINCLSSVLTQKYSNYEIVIVDNFSTDSSLDKCKDMVRNSRSHTIRLIESKKNLGYSAGNWCGFKNSSGEICVFLNNDTIVDELWLKRAIQTMQTTKADIVIPKAKLMRYPQYIDNIGLKTNILGYSWKNCEFKKDEFTNDYPNNQSGFFASGVSFFIRRKLIEEIGLFDPKFFLYVEDTDLGLRALLAGAKSVYELDSVLYHDSTPFEKISNEKLAICDRNRLMMIIKNYSKKMIILLLPLILFNQLLLIIYFMLKGKISLKIQNYIEIFHLRKPLLKDRQYIQSQSKISDGCFVKFLEVGFGVNVGTQKINALGTCFFMNKLYRRYLVFIKEFLLRSELR